MADENEWTRADRINFAYTAITFIIALVAAIPLGQKVYEDWNKPDATIAKANIHTATARGGCITSFSANGDVSHIPDGSDPWLAAQAEDGTWYPLMRIDRAVGTWQEGATITTARVQWAEIAVVMLKDSDEGQLIDYMRHLGKAQGYVHKGIILPPITETLKTWSVYSNAPWGHTGCY